MQIKFNNNAVLQKCYCSDVHGVNWIQVLKLPFIGGKFKLKFCYYHNMLLNKSYLVLWDSIWDLKNMFHLN